MLPCLRAVLRPAFSLTAGSGLARAGLRSHQTPAVASPVRFASEPPLSSLVQRCYLGTHPLKEPVEPLNSPRGAKEFIYSLHPSERTCLLRELHRFESIAIAQGGCSDTVGKCNSSMLDFYTVDLNTVQVVIRSDQGCFTLCQTSDFSFMETKQGGSLLHLLSGSE